ncbi:thioredoxin-like protein [Aspergillus crustosus]
MSLLRKIFHRKKKPPLACTELPLDELDSHIHTNACFLDIQPLTVLELYQSQGCASCPKNVPEIHKAVSSLSPNIALLTFNVTYFDRTDWTDTFAQKSWDSRQRGYVGRWNRKSLFTPQVVVDGVVDGPGQTVGDSLGLVEQAREIRRTRGWNILLDANDTDVRIDSDRAESVPHDIVLVVYDPTVQTVKVGKGVNKGKKIPHRNLVKSVQKIGSWEGGNLTLPLPDLGEARRNSWALVAFVQEPSGGPIVAAHAL